MNLAQALKHKNRLAGEIVRQQQILHRENARRNDSVSTVDRGQVLANILKLSNELGTLKAKIATANIGIYPLLERMAEYKSLIAFYQGLPKQEGQDVQFVGRDQEKLTYTWESHINQTRCDELIAKLQEDINAWQDEVDAYNATTTID